MSDVRFKRFTVEEVPFGDGVKWIGIRARGSEQSWLTPKEAYDLGKELTRRFGPPPREKLSGKIKQIKEFLERHGL